MQAQPKPTDRCMAATRHQHGQDASNRQRRATSTARSAEKIWHLREPTEGVDPQQRPILLQQNMRLGTLR